MRSIRRVDLCGSMMRIARMKRLLLVLAAVALLLLPGAARAAVCSPLNCAASQFTVGNGALIAYRHSALGPVSVTSLRTGKVLHRVPGGFSGGNVLVHQQAGKSLQWFDLRSGAARGSGASVEDSARRGLAGRHARGRLPSGPDGATTRRRREPLRDATRSSFPAGNGTSTRCSATTCSSSGICRAAGTRFDSSIWRPASSRPKPMKDPHESGTIWGRPFSRLASPDGRCCSRCTSRRTAPRWCTSSTSRRRRRAASTCPGPATSCRASTWAMALSPWRSDALGGQPRLRARGVDRRGDASGAIRVPVRTAVLEPRRRGTRLALRGDGSELASRERGGSRKDRADRAEGPGAVARGVDGASVGRLRGRLAGASLTTPASVATEISRTTSTMSRFAFHTRS